MPEWIENQPLGFNEYTVDLYLPLPDEEVVLTVRRLCAYERHPVVCLPADRPCNMIYDASGAGFAPFRLDPPGT